MFYRHNVALKGKFVLLNLDLISGIKCVHLLTNNSLVKVGILQTLFRSLEICVYPYNGSEYYCLYIVYTRISSDLNSVQRMPTFTKLLSVSR